MTFRKGRRRKLWWERDCAYDDMDQMYARIVYQPSVNKYRVFTCSWVTTDTEHGSWEAAALAIEAMYALDA